MRRSINAGKLKTVFQSSVDYKKSDSSILFQYCFLFFIRLNASKTQRSTSEVEAVIATFFECFRFIIKNNLEKPEFCSCLIKSHVSSKLIY